MGRRSEGSENKGDSLPLLPVDVLVHLFDGYLNGSFKNVYSEAPV